MLDIVCINKKQIKYLLYYDLIILMRSFFPYLIQCTVDIHTFFFGYL